MRLLREPSRPAPSDRRCSPPVALNQNRPTSGRNEPETETLGTAPHRTRSGQNRRDGETTDSKTACSRLEQGANLGLSQIDVRNLFYEMASNSDFKKISQSGPPVCSRVWVGDPDKKSQHAVPVSTREIQCQEKPTLDLRFLMEAGLRLPHVTSSC